MPSHHRPLRLSLAAVATAGALGFSSVCAAGPALAQDASTVTTPASALAAAEQDEGSTGLKATGKDSAKDPSVARADSKQAATAQSAFTPTTPTRFTPEVPVQKGDTLGSVKKISKDGSDVTLTTSSGGIIKVSFLDADTVRVQADPSGKLSDPANTDEGDDEATANIIVGMKEFKGAKPSLRKGDVLALTTKGLRLEIDKATTRMSLKNAKGDILWQERSPLSFGSKSTTQHLEHQDGEEFLGGGMQNGRSVHTGGLINISKSYDWDDEGNPNAVPYYMSSRGYGVLRDTFDRGSYDFGDEPSTTHEEKRFDAVYFAGDYKGALDSYTKLTGRPLLPPVYAMQYGDADCYNRSNPDYSSSGFGDPEGIKQKTPQAAVTAGRFKENNMPAAWMLVNDGYGCEYQDLPKAVSDIAKAADLKTGLWTERSLTDQESEVAGAGIRLRKLDVAWVGSGYRKALTGCEAAHDGIEEHSDARGTALMVEGWAGSQRCGMQWTGDHSGNLDAVRWQVSALTGSGNSGQAFTTGDVDGIFGGSTDSYVRDLQWKSFAPALYSMSGWAKTDKRPWLYGDEATKINRSYLQLRQRLMPYIYSLAANAHETGTPVMRSLPLEFPKDPGSYSANANTQFMLGDSYLVAPVYSDTKVRNGIWLPEGEDWVDYWTGELYHGGQVVNGYEAPLDKLPLFVKAGSAVPQGITARNSEVTPEDSAITLHAYPQGRAKAALTEDDKTTRARATGAKSDQAFTVTAPKQGKGSVSVKVSKRTGSYNGMAKSRPYGVAIHAVSEPSAVRVGGSKLPQADSLAAYNRASTGWFYNPKDAGGTILAKTGNTANSKSLTFTAQGTSAVGGVDKNANALTTQATLPDTLTPGQDVSGKLTITNTSKKVAKNLSVTPAKGNGLSLNQPVEIEKLAAGKSVTVGLNLKAGSKISGGEQALRFDVTGTVGTTKVSSHASAVTYVLISSVQAALDKVSTSNLDTVDKADFDGSGNSFSREQLKKAGAEPGKTVTSDGFDFTWPGADAGDADSLAPSGQRIALKGSGTKIGVLGSAASSAGGKVNLEVSYTDGSTSKVAVTLPNWLPQSSGPGDAKVALSTKGRNTPDGYANKDYTYNVYSAAGSLEKGKTISSVKITGDSSAKVFALAVK